MAFDTTAWGDKSLMITPSPWCRGEARQSRQPRTFPALLPLQASARAARDVIEAWRREFRSTASVLNPITRRHRLNQPGLGPRGAKVLDGATMNASSLVAIRQCERAGATPQSLL